MEYVGWKSAAVGGRYAGVTASVAASRRTESSRYTALTDADALPLLEGFVESCAAFPRDGRSRIPKGLGYE